MTLRETLSFRVKEWKSRGESQDKVSSPRFFLMTSLATFICILQTQILQKFENIRDLHTSCKVLSNLRPLSLRYVYKPLLNEIFSFKLSVKINLDQFQESIRLLYQILPVYKLAVTIIFKGMGDTVCRGELHCMNLTGPITAELLRDLIFP